MSKKNRRPPGSASRPAPPCVGLVSLGCAKNLVDSERLLGLVAQAGFPVCADPEQADVVLLSTCAFIGPAVEETRAEIERWTARKASGRCAALAVLGCFPKRFGEQARPPGVDAWFGVGEDAGVVAFLEGLAGKAPARGPCAPADEAAAALAPDVARLRCTPEHWAYLKVTEGCDNRCRYCTIPSIRGPLRRKPLAAIVEEAAELAGSGAREIVLIGQDTAAWRGREGRGLEAVLEALAAVKGVEWVRVLYAHPAHVSEELVRALAAGPPILPYLDLPVQHASDRILKAMGRGTTGSDIRRTVSRLRETVPGLVLRTTVMVGFPGETESEFAELLGFLSWSRIERVGAFLYSPEEGTEAAGLPGRVPAQEGRRRLEELLALAAGIRDRFHESRAGREEEGVVEERFGRRIAARTAAEAPEVDPVVLALGSAPLGARVRLRITGREGPNLTARVAGK